ncbi:hypothetical protein DXG03_004684 [Asterophora parasitica]|uniref:Uncharacterized protein n=1 Tax=Asterophora parasitica TaxID=117018 RepID=A0A9P7G2F0_9AGAR|nr:hypothetical protein DXG03_004684 [Asterophora parasitica]
MSLSPAITRIYRIRLPHSDSHPGNFELLHTLVSPVSQVARTIDPALDILVLSSVSFVDVVAAKTSDIPASPDTTGNFAETRMRIDSQSEDLEDVLNGIVTTQIMGPYIVLFKSRSIELHPLRIDLEPPNQPYFESRPQRVLEHHFPSITFRMVSSSDCLCTSQRLSFSFFGYDFLKGIFRYKVDIRFAPGLPDGTSLNVDCVGVYSMADPETSGIQAGVSSRGFVSALALGAQGKRAVWVERRRGSTVREVLVWAQPPTREVEDESITIPRHVVYRLESYDLREDLTHCAIGEISGKIVVGNRSGNVFVLYA